MLIRELGEAELGTCPQDELLGEARRVHGRERADVREVRDEIAIGDGVDAVAEGARETELPRYGLGVDRVWHTGQRAGTERRHRRALARLIRTHAIAPQRFNVRQQVVRERNGLCALQVRVPGHHCVGLVRRPLDERAR